MAAYNVSGAVVYTPSVSTVIKNGSAVTITADMTSYKLTDDYGNGGSIYFPSTSDPNTQFGDEITVKCFSGSNGGGSLLSTLYPTLVRVSGQKASITFTSPIGTRSIRIETDLYTLVGSETYDYTNSGGYVRWGAPNRYDTGIYYWTAEEPYTACRAPTAPTLDTTLSREPVRLSWGAGSNGTNNSVTGYDVQRRASTDGSSWGSWKDVPDSPVTTTEMNVSPPDTAGSYYQFRVRTRGSAGINYFSDWVTGEAGKTILRCDHEPLAGFTDDPLTAGTSPVKALHMQELQSRVNTLRTFYGLGTYSFTTITSGITSLAGWTTHVNQIRSAIEEVCTASKKTHETWISFSINCPRADIIQQLRNVILAL